MPLQYKQEENEAKKAVQERLLALIKLKEMKDQVMKACENFNKEAENNKNSTTNILEGVDKMKNFIGDQRMAVDGYNAQFQKMEEALKALTGGVQSNENVPEPRSSVSEPPKEEFNARNIEPTRVFGNNDGSSITNEELDEAFRIINNRENSTLSQIRWAKRVFDVADAYTRPKNEMGVLDSYGVVHAPSYNYGAPKSEEDSAFRHI